jgi:plasmid stabilization system protein ParE
MIVRYARRAEQDLAEILSYLEERAPVGAEKVAQSLRSSIQFIADYPLAGKRTQMPSLFVKIVPEYPYKIFCRFDGDRVDIVHVRHASRRPWFE